MPNAPMSSIFGEKIVPPGTTNSWPFHGTKFQPSEACPRNFIIFYQTNKRSQIMFHPTTGSKCCFPGSNTWAAPPEHNSEKRGANNEQREVISLDEDSDDINALLSSSDDEELAEFDEEEFSTARIDVYSGSTSPDSCSNYESPPRKSRLTCLKRTSEAISSCTEKKHLRMRQMIKGLRGIVPGANQMKTAAVLDEAVRYLKSLKVEVQKLGVGKLKSHV